MGQGQPEALDIGRGALLNLSPLYISVWPIFGDFHFHICQKTTPLQYGMVENRI